MPDITQSDRERRAALEAAEARAVELVAAIEDAGLIRAGRCEDMVEEEIYALAEARFGVRQHWHRRIVRSGPNTLTTAGDYPDVRAIGADDTVYVDLGPVFAEWEADIGRTYALGAREDRKKLVADLPAVFARVQDHFRATPTITGAELYAFAERAAADEGWAFGGAIAGHILGEFSHRVWPGEKAHMMIAPGNTLPLRRKDHLGREQNWILEIHLVDRARTFGGFYEGLL